MTQLISYIMYTSYFLNAYNIMFTILLYNNILFWVRLKGFICIVITYNSFRAYRVDNILFLFAWIYFLSFISVSTVIPTTIWHTYTHKWYKYNIIYKMKKIELQQDDKYLYLNMIDCLSVYNVCASSGYYT